MLSDRAIIARAGNEVFPHSFSPERWILDFLEKTCIMLYTLTMSGVPPKVDELLALVSKVQKITKFQTLKTK